jgi:hypothetical protein
MSIRPLRKPAAAAFILAGFAPAANSEAGID